MKKLMVFLIAVLITAFVSGQQTNTFKYVINANGGIVAPLNINAQTGSNYTLVLTDASKLITINHPDADTLIVPLNATVAFPVGTQINIVGIGVGLTFVKPFNGTVVINSSGSKVTQNAQYSVITLIKRLENTWVLLGELQ